MQDPQTSEAPVPLPSTGPVEPGTLRVSRLTGKCDRCGASNVQVITAYSALVYPGKVCGPCILDGKASERFAPEHKAMQPMVFVARALRGDQPFAQLLAEADAQRAGKKPPTKRGMSALQALAVAREISKQPNRKAKRAALARLRKSKTKVAAKKKGR